jgi:hypothetical protein
MRPPTKLDLYVNPRLRNDWLLAYPAGGAAQAPPEATYLGRYGEALLYTADREAFHQFILFTLEATNQGSAAGQSGKSGPSKNLTPTSIPYGGAIPLIAPP